MAKEVNRFQLQGRMREIEKLAIDGDYQEADIAIGKLESDMRGSPLNLDMSVNRELMALYTAVEQHVL